MRLHNAGTLLKNELFKLNEQPYTLYTYTPI